jgi:diaminopimelate epimerase
VLLTKHHGYGNDFLVLRDADDSITVTDADVVAVCDRHRGIGADGFLQVAPNQDGSVRMVLRNSDGSRAEMSGNGISCLAQALRLAGWWTGGDLRVHTDAGPRSVELVEAVDDTTHRMRVRMGVPIIKDELPEWTGEHVLRAIAVDVGNPHVVAHVGDWTEAPDLVDFGATIDHATPGGANVHLVAPGDRHGVLLMRTYERGAGPTQACGTGTVAVAAAARHWGIGADEVILAQPGGDATVALDADGEASLTVTVEAIATCTWPFTGVPTA